MNGKIKTSITVDDELWRDFKAKAARERGLKGVSEAVESCLREEMSQKIVVETLEQMVSGETTTLQVKPVKPKVKTSAGEVIREMRDAPF
ncbi:MAG: hypothetical protein ACOC6H_01000 [Thermoproteota archaeon]